MTAPGEMSLDGYLAALADRTPAPGGGSAAGVGLALAAACCEMAARFSGKQLDQATAIAAAAAAIRRRALELAGEDASAYEAVLAARRLPTEVSDSDRAEALAGALAGAVAVPRQIAELGQEVARLAQQLEAAGNPNLRGDAVAAVRLAEAAAAAASNLVEINLSSGGG
ncbi:MAG TPA: cyclodeaminase/cyclohydrolase family protein [Acidimicrobiales bacterium]|jgi:formiminotetrahydrofolate cyclodeaminase|nr:cyclodeaminase/cyclohydrolase family protein [Acidimicrobiales bacterium]